MKKYIYSKKSANVPANYVLEMHEINDGDFRRYETLNCSYY